MELSWFVTVITGGNGYLSAPTLTIGAPTGVATPVLLGPGGKGSFIQFNRDIGNSTITLDDARTLGSLSIGEALAVKSRRRIPAQVVSRVH